MRNTAILVAAAAMLGGTLLATTPSGAQTIDLGRSGIGVDLRSPGQRDRDFQREDTRRDRDYDRRSRYSDDVGTGSVGRCREVTVRERDPDGVMVTRRTRDCR